MTQFLDSIFNKACSNKKTIVLPEGSDSRLAEAARQIVDKDIANVVLLGRSEEIKAHNVDLEGIKIIDPAHSEHKDAYAQALFTLRKKKGMTFEDAQKYVCDVNYYGVLMVYMGHADGMVSGACHTTADTLRPALQILKTAKGVKLVSSVFIMNLDRTAPGDLFAFADCALNVEPDKNELAQIALASAKSFELLCDRTPYVAMLSYSSVGSGAGQSVDKVREATRIAASLAPDLAIDGELQADAAICQNVASLKAPDSPVAGKANVLIFPDINAGNIAYKLVERLAGARAFGPIMQGMAKPVNDLSRGCCVDDIIGTVAITCVQAQAQTRAIL